MAIVGVVIAEPIVCMPDITQLCTDSERDPPCLTLSSVQWWQLSHSCCRQTFVQFRTTLTFHQSQNDMGWLGLAWLSSEHTAIKSIGSRKMLALWLGPFKVIAKLEVDSVNYTLDIPGHCRIHCSFPASILHLVYDSGSGKRRPPTVILQGQEEF